MRPLLNPSDEVGVEWLPRSGSFDLRLGEVVLGRSEPGDWTVHRVIAQHSDSASWVTKGDAAFASEVLSPQQIWGRVVAIKLSSAPEASAKPKVHAFEYHWLDAWIASLSKWSLPPERLRAKLTRRLLRASAKVRLIAI